MISITPEKQTMQDIARDERSLHGPGWRCDLAEALIHRRLGPWQRRFGQEFIDLHHFRSLCAHSTVGEKQALALYPAIAAAEKLNADAVMAGHLKVAVLGELDPKEVARQFDIDEAVLRAWEMMYFDARDLRLARGWIDAHVIRPELAAGRADLAARLRMVSAVGAAAARAILQADTRLPSNEGQRLFERQLKLYLKFEAAIDMTLDTDKTRLGGFRVCRISH